MPTDCGNVYRSCADDINDEIFRDMGIRNTYLNGFIMNRVYPFNTESDAEKEKYRLMTPSGGCNPSWRPAAHFSMGDSKNVGLKEKAISSNIYTKARLRKGVYQCSRVKYWVTQQTWKGKTYLMAPAATLGLKHCPTSVPNSFPAKAIRYTLNGASGAGVSKNHVKICT